ncbi:50S ribosomal protein L15 [Succinivibrio sp. AGMB01872]|uniref:Large ribosomal subunit protein uL15 n=1 Tax=Succinivibrio faecicola TaxID=2820300 RepID=A0ABS7DFB6_9GAMM|nr:50S ribosomal protein L15 [Succinivibrio faecicola]
MRLNTFEGSNNKKSVRVGRGIGSGLGKTCGRGVKGAGARKSAHKRPGFEGGQMPLKIRLPKFGFWSPKSDVTAEVTLNDLNRIEGDVVDMAALVANRLITKKIKYVKIVLSRVPNFNKKITVKGLGVTKGAKAAIEAAGGSVEVAKYITDAAERLEASNKKSAAKQQARIDALNAAPKLRPAKKTAEQKAAKKAAAGK